MRIKKEKKENQRNKIIETEPAVYHRYSRPLSRLSPPSTHKKLMDSFEGNEY